MSLTLRLSHELSAIPTLARMPVSMVRKYMNLWNRGLRYYKEKEYEESSIRELV